MTWSKTPPRTGWHWVRVVAPDGSVSRSGVAYFDPAWTFSGPLTAIVHHRRDVPGSTMEWWSEPLQPPTGAGGGDVMEPGDILMPDGMMRLSKMFCGCVTPENTYGAILAELERLERGEFKKDDDLAASIVNFCRLSDHGVSIRGGSLTKDGEAVLAFLREYGIDWSDDTRNFVDSEGVYHSHT